MYVCVCTYVRVCVCVCIFYFSIFMWTSHAYMLPQFQFDLSYLWTVFLSHLPVYK